MTRLALLSLLLAVAAGAGVAWYRVADRYTVSSQLSPAVAAGFGGLASIGLIALTAAAFASRREARQQRAARTETIALATAAVQAMLRRRQP
jgi:hypothetical protein